MLVTDQHYSRRYGSKGVYVCMYVCVCVYVCVCMYVSMYVCMYVYAHTLTWFIYIYIRIS